MAETVLIVGATGNMGTAATIAVLRSKRNVLAIVRNQNSADKLVKNVGTSEGITFVESSIASTTGIREVVERVRRGALPAFQHVWSSAGADYTGIPIQEIGDEYLRDQFNLSFETNFRAYRDTIGYLHEQNNPNSTWTVCTGAQGELAFFPLPAMTQGALFSMSIAAGRENEKTNVRFNELFLAFRVEVDESARQHDVVTATEFSYAYEGVLADQTIRSSRIRVDEVKDIKTLKHAKLFDPTKVFNR